MKHAKTWGSTRRVFAGAGCAVDVLDVRAGGFSSEHRHARKSNLFFILSGALTIHVWQPGPGGEIRDTTTVHAGESTTVPPGTWHQFRSPEDCRALEISYIADEFPLDADIERRRSGGPA